MLCFQEMKRQSYAFRSRVQGDGTMRFDTVTCVILASAHYSQVKVARELSSTATRSLLPDVYAGA